MGRFYQKDRQGVIIHDWLNPLGDNLPKKLEVGDQLDLPLPWNAESGLADNPSQLGMIDSFGRIHWAPRWQLKRAVEEWRADFLDAGARS